MTETRKPILVVLHRARSTPGRLGEKLVERGYRLDIRRPRYGDPLPESLAAHTGAIVFGGPMSVNDGDEYLRTEAEWMAVPLREKAPLIALCLGAQLLARHLGANVWRHPEGAVEVGWFSVSPTEAGRRLFDWPSMVHQFHSEGFDLPPGATLLATGDQRTFPNQAYAYGDNAIAIQFHIELTELMVERWTEKLSDDVQRPGGHPREHHIEGRRRHDGETNAFLDQLLDHWLSSDQRAH